MRAVLQLCGVLVALGLGVTAAHPATAEPEPRENHGSWEEVQAPEGITEPHAIDVVNDNDVWVFGKDAKDKSQSAHWDGKEWTLNPVPNFDTLHTVEARSAEDVWIGGVLAGNKRYLAHWDGKEWQVVDPGEKFTMSVGDIEIVGDDVWVAGGCCGAPEWLIRWDGQQWHEHKIPTEQPPGMSTNSPNEYNYVDKLSATDSGELIGAGYGSKGTTVLIHGGKDGFTRDKPPAGLDMVRDTGTPDGKTIYASGQTGRSAEIYRRSGEQWSREESFQEHGCILSSMARAGTSLYASSSMVYPDSPGCAVRLNPDNAKWEKIPSHGLSMANGVANSVISGRADSDLLWAFGKDDQGTHVKQYRP